MRDGFDKKSIKYLGENWKDMSYYDEVDEYNVNSSDKSGKKTKKFKDETKDFNRGKKLNKRTYR